MDNTNGTDGREGETDETDQERRVRLLVQDEVHVEDWQGIATDLLRPLLVAHEDDLGEVNEIIAEAEKRAEAQS